VGIALHDAQRDPPESVDVLAASAGPSARGAVILDGARLGGIVAGAHPHIVHDVDADETLGPARHALRAADCRAALLAPLLSGAGVFGAVVLGARRPAAFDTIDAEIAAEMTRPLAAAIQRHRLIEETRRRTEELAALVRTSQLITARLDLAAVLDQISR